MSDEDTDDRDGPEPDGPEDRPRGFRLEAGLRPLSDLLGSLIEAGVSESPPPAADPTNRTAVDERDGGSRRSGSDSRRGRTRRVRTTGSGSGDALVDSRFDDDEFVVTADVTGASVDDVSVGIDPETNDLVIGRDGSVLERVSLPWESPEPTRVWFNNGVLEVRLRSTNP